MLTAGLWLPVTPGVECEAYADIDVNELEKFRQKFPVLNDGDDFSLK